MPKLSLVRTNFTAGEISPRCYGRVDIAKYANGCKTLHNAYPRVHGGATRRPGTVYKASTKDSTKRARLIPFVFSRSQAFVLEFGDQYIRFFNPSGQLLSGGSPLELVTPYLEADLPDLHFVQSADVMFIAHPDYAMRKLIRYGNTNWKLATVTYDVPPNEELGDRPATTLTLSDATVGAGRTATAGAAAFNAADVGRFIDSGAGLAEITAVGSATSATVTIQDAFSGTAIASGDWKILGSPRAKVTPSIKEPVGEAITLTGAADTWKDNAQVSHKGAFVEINGGLVEITAVSSPAVANGIIRSNLTGTTAAPADAWALRQNIWNDIDGYPRAVTLYQQRLVAGGSDAFPRTFHASRIAEFENFSTGGSDDDAAFSYELSSDQVCKIEHFAQLRELIVLTEGQEFSAGGGADKPFIPSNPRVRSESAEGCNTCRPVRVGNEIIFVQAGGETIHTVGYRYEIDAFASPDISILAEHITEGGVSEMAFQRKPDKIVWMVRGDGKLVSLSIDRDQDVVGYALHETDGTVESVCSIPNGTDDQVWLIVRRTINGATVRYVEVLDAARNTDCCATGTSATPETVWSGLDHLEGREVDVVQDGYYGGRKTVTAGAITLDYGALEVEIGLPYTTTITPLPLEVGTGTGTAQGNPVSVHEIIVRVHESVGCKVNGQQIPTRSFAASGVLDQPLDTFTGDYRVENLGWTRGGGDTVSIVQELPLPLTVLAIIQRCTVNDG